MIPTPVRETSLTEESFDADTTQDVTSGSTLVSDSILGAGIILYFSVVDSLSITRILVLARPEDSLVDWFPPGSDRQVVRMTLRERLRLLHLRRYDHH